MLILTHIIIALSSIAFSTWLFVMPSRPKLYVSYGLVAATLLSGSYLVWHLHAPMVQSCVSGLLYLGLVAVGLVRAHYALASHRINDKTD